MVSRIHREIEDELFVLHRVLREILRRNAAFESIYQVEVIRKVTRGNHLDYDLTDVPVLSLTQQLKDVVLRVEKDFESDGTVMVLEDALVVVAQRFRVLHCN